MLTLRTHGYGCNVYRRPYSNAIFQICGDPINILGHSREFSLQRRDINHKESAAPSGMQK